ncbi:hypothetical protein EV193_108165 [Herbihabitans rhizosphaerae]|uniref:Uncharacterized protein n=1 Tax=Herbihabitans rhizosphaerae TaxID=1872711 RepID=A0A4Q7KLJ3_9PSEU|nr:hypothetical protein [Herbihabitans rhizosphaerae]RZS34816.1 hypothetical protein EV193_108165 [Herbihabitans rhizosphaerae]
MLYIILVLALGALGLLIAALTTANTLWAWLSVIVSVAAAGLLVLDWSRNRRASQPDEGAAVGDDRFDESQHGRHEKADEATQAPGERIPPPGAVPVEHTPEAVRLDEPVFDIPPAESTGAHAAVEPDEQPTRAMAPPPPPTAAETTAATATSRRPPIDPDAEPPEEPTDAADLLVVSDLSAEVVVLDERPRYHLARCTWLGAREIIPLPVNEARSLGFTPCAYCGPDAVLAERHRAGRRPKRGAR